MLKKTYLTNKTVTCLGEGNYRRSSAATFCIGDDSGFSTFHGSNSGVGCSQVNTDDLK
jgi:hypothetical protein